MRKYIKLLATTLIAITLCTMCEKVLTIVQNFEIPNLDAPIAAPVETTAGLEWDENIAPNYVAVTGQSDFEPESKTVNPGEYEIFKDANGDTRLVTGNVTYEMYQNGSSRERNDLPNPKGWPKNAEVTIEFADGTYHGWLFNRSHLLAKSLGGPDTADNLVTGTRCQNVGNNDSTGGMAYTETLAREWLKNHPDGTVLYEVEPVYLEGEQIPRVVEVDIFSSDGQLNEHCITYNTAKGYEINYETSSWKALSGK